MFYVVLTILGLIIWMVYTFITGSANFLNFSLLGLVVLAIVALGMHQGYRRGWRKETIFAGTLIVIYGLRGFIYDLLINIYNFISNLAITQLNNRGITTINPETAKWKHSAQGDPIVETIIFITLAIASYAFTSGKPKGPPPKPGEKPGAKDNFGAAVGGVGAALFVTYLFLLSGPFLAPLYNFNLLSDVRLSMPSIKLPDLQVTSQSNGPPTAGLERWLPVVLFGIVIIYVVYQVFVSPPTKTKTRLNTNMVLGLALLLAIVWVFAIRTT